MPNFWGQFHDGQIEEIVNRHKPWNNKLYIEYVDDKQKRLLDADYRMARNSEGECK